MDSPDESTMKKRKMAWKQKLPPRFLFWLEAVGLEVVLSQPEDITRFACNFFENELSKFKVDMINVPTKSYFTELSTKKVLAIRRNSEGEFIEVKKSVQSYHLNAEFRRDSLQANIEFQNDDEAYRESITKARKSLDLEMLAEDDPNRLDLALLPFSASPILSVSERSCPASQATHSQKDGGDSVSAKSSASFYNKDIDEKQVECQAQGLHNCLDHEFINDQCSVCGKDRNLILAEVYAQTDEIMTKDVSCGKTNDCLSDNEDAEEIADEEAEENITANAGRHGQETTEHSKEIQTCQTSSSSQQSQQNDNANSQFKSAFQGGQSCFNDSPVPGVNVSGTISVATAKKSREGALGVEILTESEDNENDIVDVEINLHCQCTKPK